MQIVIDIDENKLWEIKNEPIKKNFNIYELASYIDKGIPLPKGHGGLVDADYLLTSERPKGIADDVWKESHIYKLLSNAPTIIEADKEID